MQLNLVTCQVPHSNGYHVVLELVDSSRHVKMHNSESGEEGERGVMEEVEGGGRGREGGLEKDGGERGGERYLAGHKKLGVEFWHRGAPDGAEAKVRTSVRVL
jgi:hypothetical protein